VTFPYRSAWAFTTPIPAAPKLDPNSPRIAKALADPVSHRVLNIGAYGIPVYTADSSTPRYSVDDPKFPLVITKLGTSDGQDGDNDLAHCNVPIPLGAAPATGTDQHLVILDPESDRAFTLWRAEKTKNGWQCDWGAVLSLSGDGASWNSDTSHVAWGKPMSRSSGSGIAVNCGLATVAELGAGVIPHALIFSSDLTAAGAYRYPATTTDGGGPVDGGHLPQGARIQLDPSINLAALPGITPVELAIGKALQTFGAYCADTGGSRIAISCEVPNTSTKQAIYTAKGLVGDWGVMPHLPWTSLRVLARWDGG
jgi:hypothetical protein